MYNLFLILHTFVAIAVIGVILVQRGRSGGIIESLGGVESIFGTKTSSFFVKATVVLAVLFFITSISVAYVSKQKGRSLIDKYEEKVVTQEQDKVVKPQENVSTQEESSPQGEPSPEDGKQ